jgi:hypothetical protein
VQKVQFVRGTPTKINNSQLRPEIDPPPPMRHTLIDPKNIETGTPKQNSKRKHQLTLELWFGVLYQLPVIPFQFFAATHIQMQLLPTTSHTNQPTTSTITTA